VYRSTTVIADQIKKALAGKEVSSIIEINEFTLMPTLRRSRMQLARLSVRSAATDITERMMPRRRWCAPQQRSPGKRLLNGRILFARRSTSQPTPCIVAELNRAI
jgi:hypothetical protein